MPKIFTDKDREIIRMNLLRKGLESLDKKGYSASSVEHIAHAAGIAKGTFYNFFKSKEQFFYEVMLYIRDKNREELYVLFSSKSALDRNMLANYLYRRYTIGKNIYHYFSIDELNIIFRKLPEQLAGSNIDSESLVTELLIKLPDVNPHLDTIVVVNMMNLLGIFSANRETLSSGSYTETIRMMADSLADYVFDVPVNK